MVRDKHEDMFSAMFDRDATSTIDINEFKTLWQFIVQWEKIFRGYDEDGSGKIDKDEFRKALTSFGNDERKENFQRKESVDICISIDTLFGNETIEEICSFFVPTGMFDRDGSATIDFQEFRALWRYVTEWEKCFRSVLIAHNARYIVVFFPLAENSI